MFIKVTNNKKLNTLIDKINEGNCLVLYYANWCGPCQRFKPTWNKLVKMVKNNQEYTIGEIEHSFINSIDNTNIQSFPTVKFYKGNTEYNKLKNKLVSNNENAIHQKNKKTKQSTNNKPFFTNLLHNMGLINNSNLNNENSNNKFKIMNGNYEDFNSQKERNIHNLLEFINQHKSLKSKSLKSKSLKSKSLKSKTMKSKTKSKTMTLKNKKSKTMKSKTKSKTMTLKNKKSKTMKSKLKNKKQLPKKKKTKKNNTNSINFSKKYQLKKSKDQKAINEILKSFKMN